MLFDRLATATFVVSHGMANMMRARGWRSPLRYFYNTHSGMAFVSGSITAAPITLPDDDVFVIVYEGGLQRHVRGIEEQFDALALALSQHPNLMLWLVGAGELDYFRALAREMGLERHVRIDDTVDPSVLNAILERADLAVWNGIVVGLPSKIFDYIAHGIPVLSRNDDSDVNSVCRSFVKLYGTSAGDLAQAISVFCSQGTHKRESRARGAAEGDEFIMRLHRESEATLLEVFQEIALAKTMRSQSGNEA
jgi:glycosyltransferase involved in cell wall biosynthesis